VINQDELDSQMGALRQGEHLCSVYENTDEMLAQAVPYLKYGLVNGEQCIYVADEHSTETISEALRRGGIDVGRALEQGRLLFWTRQNYRQPGEFDLEIMYRFVERTLERGIAAGYSGIRLAVEMTWTVNNGISPECLVRWEDLINKLSYPGSKVSFICQYNARLLAHDLIRRAVCVHPVVVLGHCVCPNLHYQPAKQALKDGGNGDLYWLLGRIRAEADARNGKSHGGNGHARGPHAEAQDAGQPASFQVVLQDPRSDSLSQSHLPTVYGLIEQVVRTLPLGVYICEAPSGSIKYFNRAAEEVWGRSPRIGETADRFCGAWKLYRPDGAFLPHDACPMAETIRKGVVFRDQEVIVEQPDGSRRTILVNITPIRGQQGELIGALNLVQDISERKRSEAAKAQLVQDLERSKLELQEKILDLQKFEEVVVGREIKMIDLERENKELKQRLIKLGETPTTFA
jgi:PAS domain-containing protein